MPDGTRQALHDGPEGRGESSLLRILRRARQPIRRLRVERGLRAFELTRTSVYNLHYLKDVKADYPPRRQRLYQHRGAA